MGTAASVSQVTAWTRPQPHYSLIVKGLCRFRIKEVKRETPFPVAEVTQLDYLNEKGTYELSIGKDLLIIMVPYPPSPPPPPPPPPDDPLPAALQSRAEEFKSSVTQLVDLLDLNHPSTARLKVKVVFRY